MRSRRPTIFRWVLGAVTVVALGVGIRLVANPAPKHEALPQGDVERGRALFTRTFSAVDGLGPGFNSASCASCHFLPSLGGAGDLEHIVAPRHPRNPGPVPAEAFRLVAPPLFGLGLLDRIPDDLLINGCGVSKEDGVQGRAIVDKANRGGLLGVNRFGAKGTAHSLEVFCGGAAVMEMGLTIPSSDQGEPITDTDAVADPEVSAAQVADLAAFVASLPPIRPERPSPQGEWRFRQNGCAICHQPERDGAYSDLCVHRMGAELASQKAETAAAGDEWRTAPLWGLRQRHRYLHDGRATSLDAAIRLHGGEATTARDRYVALPEPERAALLDFLSTL